MLKPEDARRQLGEWQSEKLKRVRVERLNKLPKAAAAAGFGLFRLSPGGKELKDWSEGYALQRLGQRAIAADPAMRKKVLTALFPTFAQEIERGFAVLTRLPYPVGYARRPFRAPKRLELSASLGCQYLDCVTDALSQVPDDMLTPEWVAAWAMHLNGNTDRLGFLFAGQVDAGNDAVLEILKDSAANRHAIGGPGGHAIRGLLCCERPAGWEFAANLLLAAQRQEGLRQSILEAVDEAHPQAFQKMLGIVLDQNLIRFAAVARAAGVWMGEELMVEDAKGLKAALTTIRDLQSNAATRAKALKSGDAVTLYRALWTLAFENIDAAVAAAKPILKEKDVGRRVAVVKLLGESNLTEAAVLVLPLLSDSDPRIQSAALMFFTTFNAGDWDSEEMAEGEKQRKPFPKILFESLEKMIPTLPAKPTTVKSPVPTWPMADLSQTVAANLLVECLQDRNAERLLPWIEAMAPHSRVTALAKLCTPRTLTTKVRATLMACATETNTYVREAALGYLKKCKLAEDEVRTLEGHLTRKQPDFRRSVFELLLNRPDALAVQSVERLLPGDALQRAGGIELARRLTEANRQTAAVHKLLATHLESKGARLPEADRDAIDRILHPPEKPATLDDGLGLFDPKDRSPVVPPKKQNVVVTSPAAVAFLKSLDDLIHENRQKTFTRSWGERKEELVLGSISYWQFPGPDSGKSPADDLENWPLREIWLEWYDNRPAVLRDRDGLELIRAMILERVNVRDGDESSADESEYLKDAHPDFAKAILELNPFPPLAVRYSELIKDQLNWLMKIRPPKNFQDFLLDAAEKSLAVVPRQSIEALPEYPKPDADEIETDEDREWQFEWRSRDLDWGYLHNGFIKPLTLFGYLTSPQNRSAAQQQRYSRLLRYLEEPRPNVVRHRPEFAEFLEGYRHGVYNLADFYDHVIGPRFGSGYHPDSFDDIRWLTNEVWSKDYPLVQQSPELKTAINNVLNRIVEVELARGEAPSAATTAANNIGDFPGIHPLLPLLEALGKNGFAKSGYDTGTNKPASLTHLVQVLVPAKDDTPAAFRAAALPWIESGKIPLERFAELGLVNPKLVSYAAAVVNWPGYEEACYWFMAHSNSDWSRTIAQGESRYEDSYAATWRTIVKGRSNLSAEQRADGVIDVDWFHKAYAALGKDDRWDAVEKAARFLGYGHAEKKASRLADVLLGRTKKKELVENIQKKYLKESVRLLGLLPLPEDAKKRDVELADRYSVLKAYERYARGLSSLSKEPAMQSYRLGMENLAVTAGFSDPVRLEWAVTAKETADLAKGPVTVKVKDVALSLKLGDFAEPETSQTQGGKDLKSLPKNVKANKAVEELLERKKNLKRLVSSTKRTLELAMCAGDRFTAAELTHLMTHPLVRPFLERLVLKTDSGMGYPVKGGSALQLPTGKTVPVKANAEWSIAHPLDFVASKNWHDYQAECFQAERIQPFKQIFREVYTLTPAEKDDGDKSRRYSGQQVNENQAKALLSSRGWSTKEDLSKLYRTEGINVDLYLDQGYSTPGDAAAPAVQDVRFTKRGEIKAMALKNVPAVIFSEVMRDLDLVVSVAHVGGVDPEATQSTVAMRSTLLQETCTLLKLANVKLDSKHALIQGEYGQYSVHLGSGVVHKQPGGSLCVVAVNAQHRGRLFLPFADDDPRTAEVVTKVLLLARDTEIQDPTILAQITGR